MSDESDSAIIRAGALTIPLILIFLAWHAYYHRGGSEVGVLLSYSVFPLCLGAIISSGFYVSTSPSLSYVIFLNSAAIFVFMFLVGEKAMLYELIYFPAIATSFIGMSVVSVYGILRLKKWQRFVFACLVSVTAFMVVQIFSIQELSERQERKMRNWTGRSK